MSTMNKNARIIAAAGTLLAALLVVITLGVITLSYVPQTTEWPPRHDGEVALMPPEEFIEVIHEPPAPVHSSAAPAKLPEKVKNTSTPAPASGHHTTDRGKAGDAPSTVTSRQPSPVKEQVKEQPVHAGPTKEEIEAQKQEEARRRASSATASAFNRAKGKNNTESKGREEGDSGAPNGRSQSVSGTGSGTVGGGWSIPGYAKVPATVTGSIKMKVTVDSKGNAVKVAFQGGDAPAATDSRLRAAVEKEVRSRKFTRPDYDNAPETSTAYITYVFK